VKERWPTFSDLVDGDVDVLNLLHGVAVEVAGVMGRLGVLGEEAGVRLVRD
jgi:hypothetical protein